ncbi:21235_t:CDS:2, partial [Rhizophagus irregularis]
NKLEIYICEQIELVYQNKYNLTYKSSTESGTRILLDNEEAFSKFIKDYQTMILGNKKNEVSEQEVSNDELKN